MTVGCLVMVDDARDKSDNLFGYCDVTNMRRLIRSRTHEMSVCAIVHVCMCFHLCMCVVDSLFVFACSFVWLCMCLCACVCAYVHVCVCVCVRRAREKATRCVLENATPPPRSLCNLPPPKETQTPPVYNKNTI
jgi:hypothetical protein